MWWQTDASEVDKFRERAERESSRRAEVEKELHAEKDRAAMLSVKIAALEEMMRKAQRCGCVLHKLPFHSYVLPSICKRSVCG